MYTHLYANAEPMLFINILYVFVGENWKRIFLAHCRHKFQYWW